MPRAAQHSVHPSSPKLLIWAPVSEGSGKSRLLFFYPTSFSPWPALGFRGKKFIGRLAWPNGQGGGRVKHWAQSQWRRYGRFPRELCSFP